MSSDSTKVEGDFVYFRYTAGLAGEKFFREIKDNGKLVASRCDKCNLNYLPPRVYCERCMSKLEEYVQVESSGVVEPFTLCHQDADGNEMDHPVGIALVRFPGAHGGIIHKTKQKLSIGDKVRVLFREKSKRTGSILDIEGFEKLP
jgi:hypothetical protein